MGIFEYSVTTDAIIGGIIALLIFVFCVVNAIYWSNIVNEFNTNALKATTATISKSTAEFLMIISIIFAVITALYMLYNLGRWFFNSNQTTLARQKISEAVVAAKTKASTVATDVKNKANTAANTITKRIDTFVNTKKEPIKLETKCERVDDCSKCAVRYDRENLDFVARKKEPIDNIKREKVQIQDTRNNHIRSANRTFKTIDGKDNKTIKIEEITSKNSKILDSMSNRVKNFQQMNESDSESDTRLDLTPQNSPNTSQAANPTLLKSSSIDKADLKTRTAIQNNFRNPGSRVEIANVTNAQKFNKQD